MSVELESSAMKACLSLDRAEKLIDIPPNAFIVKFRPRQHQAGLDISRGGDIIESAEEFSFAANAGQPLDLQYNVFRWNFTELDIGRRVLLRRAGHHTFL